MRKEIRAKIQQGTRDWYRISNLVDDNKNVIGAEIYIYDEIGYLGITAQNFLKDINNLDVEKMEVHLNTPGGEVFDGIAIYNALKQHKAHVTIVVDSLAASIGSVIAMAGDEVIMAKNSTMMIHEGQGLAVGDAASMRQLADLLDKTSDNIASVYADRAGGTVEDWRNKMKEETWYSAQEAVEAGLADRVEGSDITNEVELSIFTKSAEPIKASAEEEIPSFDMVEAIREALKEANK